MRRRLRRWIGLGLLAIAALCQNAELAAQPASSGGRERIIVRPKAKNAPSAGSFVPGACMPWVNAHATAHLFNFNALRDSCRGGGTTIEQTWRSSCL